MKTVSIFQRITDTVPFGEIGFEDLKRVMESDILHKMTDDVRNAVDDGTKREYKMRLPNITVNGTFLKRGDAYLGHYNQITAVDFDHIPDDMMSSLWDFLCQHPFTHFLFESPSGNGLKLIVRHDNTHPEWHTLLYPQLIAAYRDFLKIPYVDDKVKDLSRATYLAYDPEAYYNPNSQVFKFDYSKLDGMELPTLVRQPMMSRPVYNAEPMSEHMRMLNRSYQLTWKDKALMDYIAKAQWQNFPEDYEKGNRNDSLVKKATQLCRCGVDYELALWKLGVLYGKAGTPEADVEERVSYAYRKNADCFGVDRAKWEQKRDNGRARYQNQKKRK